MSQMLRRCNQFVATIHILSGHGTSLVQAYGYNKILQKQLDSLNHKLEAQIRKLNQEELYSFLKANDSYRDKFYKNITNPIISYCWITEFKTYKDHMLNNLIKAKEDHYIALVAKDNLALRHKCFPEIKNSTAALVWLLYIGYSKSLIELLNDHDKRMYINNRVKKLKWSTALKNVFNLREKILNNEL